jgi:hypothetical protein
MEIIESNLKFKSLSYDLVPVMIVLHHAEASNCTIEDIHQWHLENGWSGCGYHYFVRKDGSIYRGRPEGAIGSHCLGANDKAIGICAEGSYMTETMPEVQKKAIIELARDICQRKEIKQVYAHRELKETNCPGTNYPFEEIKQAIFAKEVEKAALPSDFNEKFYLFKYPDVDAAVKNGDFTSGADHYLQYGHNENREYKPSIPVDFNPIAYMNNNPDVAKAYAELHYVSYGIYEGRGWY